MIPACECVMCMCMTKDSKKWTHEAVLSLISNFRLHETELQSVQFKKRQVWETIASAVEQETGFKSTSLQVTETYHIAFPSPPRPQQLILSILSTSNIQQE